MAVARETSRWDRLLARRTRGDVGEGIAAVLGFLGQPDLISFAGGFPDPLTFPRERASALLEEFIAQFPANQLTLSGRKPDAPGVSQPRPAP